jgi:hypothetical protein
LLLPQPPRLRSLRWRKKATTAQDPIGADRRRELSAWTRSSTACWTSFSHYEKKCGAMVTVAVHRPSSAGVDQVAPVVRRRCAVKETVAGRVLSSAEMVHREVHLLRLATVAASAASPGLKANVAARPMVLRRAAMVIARKARGAMVPAARLRDSAGAIVGPKGSIRAVRGTTGRLPSELSAGHLGPEPRAKVLAVHAQTVLRRASEDSGRAMAKGPADRVPSAVRVTAARLQAADRADPTDLQMVRSDLSRTESRRKMRPKRMRRRLNPNSTLNRHQFPGEQSPGKSVAVFSILA